MHPLSALPLCVCVCVGSLISAAPAAAVTGVPAAPAVTDHALQGRRHVLIRLAQDGDELARHLAGLVGEEGDGHALGAGTARAADAVDVVLNVVGPGRTA